ncbi:MAG: hypothetical protein U0575_17165 [Phycisphaerales bacterium]
MKNVDRRNMFVGVVVGIGVAAFTGALMGQGASQPVKSETQYFVTGEADEAHLWVREGSSLRCVGHGECTAHKGHDHKDGDGHDHDKAAPKK